jgi:hypothetical protein
VPVELEGLGLGGSSTGSERESTDLLCILNFTKINSMDNSPYEPMSLIKNNSQNTYVKY